MELNFKIVSFRGTIFTSRIPYNNENLLSVLKDFEGFIPSNNTPNFTNVPTSIGGAFIPIPNMGTWQIKSSDSRITILFLEQKVDVLINVAQTPYSKDAVKTLARECKELLTKLSKTFALSMSRLAIAPNLVHVVKNHEELSDFAKHSFGEVKFKNEIIDNATFSKVFRHKEKILNEEYKINYLVNVHNGTTISVINNNPIAQDTILAEFDINTYVSPKYVFSSEAMADFLPSHPNGWMNISLLFLQMEKSSSSEQEKNIIMSSLTNYSSVANVACIDVDYSSQQQVVKAFKYSTNQSDINAINAETFDELQHLTNYFLNLLHLTYFEDGMSNEAIEWMQNWMNMNRSVTCNWLAYLFSTHQQEKNIISKLLRIVAHLELDQYTTGLLMTARACLNDTDIEVQESALMVFENWPVKESLDAIEQTKFNSTWIKSYAAKIANQIKNEIARCS